jgi:predicted secreted hydrolase
MNERDRRARAAARTWAWVRWAAARIALLTLFVGLGIVALVMVTEGPHWYPAGPVRARLSVAEALSSVPAAGFARALAPRPFAFPHDHGPHPDFRTEWWYWTGNLLAPSGRHFGFQLTFFRAALAPATPPRQSAWATNQVYLAHFALTDTRSERFRSWSRTSRAALDLAGATGEPFRVWVGDWEARSEGPSVFPMRLRVGDEDVSVDLWLGGGKPLVLQGEQGLSRKGPEPGNASYYYSFTRMPARGVVRVRGERLDVEGLAWMDREWSTSALGGDLAGWDWFAIQLEDGRDLMFYQLRRRDGRPAEWSAGVMVDAKGQTRALASTDVRVETRGTWRSPRSGVAYPVGWRLTDLRDGLTLELEPRLPDQELDVSPRYWEGAVKVRGLAGSRTVLGSGYVELVGYGERGLGAKR